MGGAEGPDWETMLRQARQHLDSLRAAGVEWLPAPPLRAGQGPADAQTTRSTSPLAGPAASPQPASIIPGKMLPFDQPAPILSLEDRRRALDVLSATVSNCPRCAELVATRTQ